MKYHKYELQIRLSLPNIAEDHHLILLTAYLEKRGDNRRRFDSAMIET